MTQNVIYTERQPDVRYYKINEQKADVIVNKFIEEVTETFEDGTKQTNFLYEMNTFSVNPNEITLEMVESDLEYYLDYPKKEDISEKVSRLEEENAFLTQCIIEMSEVLYNG